MEFIPRPYSVRNRKKRNELEYRSKIQLEQVRLSFILQAICEEFLLKYLPIS